MLVIREAQFNSLSLNLRQRFIDDMVHHLHEDFPRECEAHALSKEKLEPLITQGMDDAANYGVTNRQDVKLYLECLVLLSPSFDVDKNLGWAGDTLRRTDIDGTAKMDIIHDYLIFPGNNLA